MFILAIAPSMLSVAKVNAFIIVAQVADNNLQILLKKKFLIDTPGHARGPKCITASVEADLNPGVLEAQRIF